MNRVCVRALLLATSFASGITVVATPAEAQPITDQERAAAAAASAPPKAETPPLRRSKKLEWREDWPRVTWYEALGTVAVGGGLLAAHLALPGREGTAWNNGFDDAGRDALRLHDMGNREAVADASDVLFYGLMAYPVVVDTLIVTLPRSPDVAWQMFVMNAQGIAFAGLGSVLTERLAGRERPYVEECDEDPGYHKDCAAGPGKQNVSFIGGHTAMTFAGAGLMCAHHQNLPLYGGGFADTAACITALTAANVQGAFRVAADRHWATDVIVGSAVGFASGYGLPMLLHYGHGDDEMARRVVVTPMGGPDQVGLVAAGAF